MSGKHLTRHRHIQRDLFVADVWGADPRDDIASMEHPIFALKAGDRRDIEYTHNGVHVAIRPTSKGRATIHDKDVWIYCISRLVQALDEGAEVSRTVRFSAYDFLTNTNRDTSGRAYERMADALDRLSGTRIRTDIETGGRRESRGFGLIDSWRVIEEHNGRAVAVEVTLPEWLMRAVEDRHVLKISPDYFRLRKPLDRRIYELARKHCGHQGKWTVSLKVLHKKSGSTDTLRKFRAAIRSLAESDELPDYALFYDAKRDQVRVYPRNPKGMAALAAEAIKSHADKL